MLKFFESAVTALNQNIHPLMPVMATHIITKCYSLIFLYIGQSVWYCEAVTLMIDITNENL